MNAAGQGNAAEFSPDMPILTREQAREVDRRAIEVLRVHSLVLMENAGRGAADVLCS
jgi:NAD(P)H-hydrate epimerase